MVMERAIRFFHQRFAERVTMKEAARVACLSPNHFVKVFRSAVGCTPYQYLLQYRLRHARQVIASDGYRLPLAEIAVATGFFDQAHLTRHFQRAFGQSPCTEAPLDAPALGWGIIGPGRIASAFAESLAAHTRQRIVAIGSRSIETASNFAKRFDGCDAVRSYEELVKHPGVDIVYVSTPHTFHYQCTMLALDAGKHVLVGKPFAINAHQAKEMAQAAHQKGLFLMEAMWPRFLHAFDSVRQIVIRKVISNCE
jgi:AraC-like DNA-binding protein